MEYSKGLRVFNRGLIVTVVALSMGVATSVAAQSTQIDLNQFRPAELATDGFALSTPDGQGHLRFGVQLWIDYSDDPLKLDLPGGGTAEPVHQQLTQHVMLSLGLADRLVLFVDLPYNYIIREGSSGVAGVPLPATKRSNLGDLYFGARLNFYGTREDIFQIGAQAALTINTASLASNRQNFAGQVDKSPYLGGWFELLLAFNAGDFVRIPLQVGYKLGTQGQRVTPNLFVGNEFTFGGGVMIMLGDDQFMISAEAFGRTAANSTVDFWAKQETPVEVLGGFKWLPKFGFTLGVGGSTDVTKGYGAPDWRVFGMVGYTMPGEQKEPDADNDGVPDATDRCPNEPEDMDGFQDEDGCPDLDNDGDGILDADDKCPNESEDIDGFEDEDGCPDLDNDGDGILDVDDACPNDPGAPENNGCPDPDRDGDGVPDRIDNCPDEPGTVENNGCQQKQLVVIGADQLEILEKVYFRKGSAKLQKRSWALLDNVAAVLIAHPEIKKLRVEGHTDKSGSLKYNMILSKKRANTVVRYLVGRGQVSPSRLVAKGFGPKRPLVKDAKTKEEEALNRRVEFHIAAKDEPKK